MKTSESLSLLISLAALVVALASVYFAHWRVVDDVRVVSEGAPIFEFNYKDNFFQLRSVPAITLINSGSRSAAISELRFEAADKQGDGCDGPRAERIYFDPFVLKHSEIAIRRPRHFDQSARIEAVESAGQKKIAVFCLTGAITTPDNAVNVFEIKLFEVTFAATKPPKLYDLGHSTPLFDVGVPIRLLE